MKKLFALLFTCLVSSALAQDGPNHAMPVFGGAGFVGFRAAGPCVTGQALVWTTGADPTCSGVAPTNLVVTCDGTTDVTAIINAAETTVSAAGGGILQFPSGTCIVTGVTKRSNTVWRGAGIGATTIKLKASTTVNAVVAGLNAYTLFGGGTFAGIENWMIVDMTIDGNRQNSGVADCLGVYGWAWKVIRTELQNCTGWGVRTEYPIAVDGSLPDHGDNASAWFNENLVHDNNLGGLSWAGPQDSSLIGNYIYRNLVVGLKTVAPGGVALKIVNSHVWGSSVASRQAVTGILLDTLGNHLSNTTVEGSTAQQVWIRSTNQTITGGRYFYANATPNSVTCFRLGDTGGGLSTAANTIITQTTDCQAATINFDFDSGLNTIFVNAFNQSATSTGFTGTSGGNSTINLNVSGTSVTNPTKIQQPIIELTGTGAITNGFIRPSSTTVQAIANSGIAGEFVGAASGVNYFQFSNGAAGSGPGMLATGTDTNVGWGISSKGAGTYFFFTDGFTAQQFGIGRVASANRFISVAGANGGNPVLSTSAGGLAVAPNNGHTTYTGTAPTLTAGCNGAGQAISGSDTAGTITGQTAASTTCTLTFATAFAAAPNCVATGQSSPLTGAVTVGTGTLVVNFTSTANFKWSYICFGS